MPIIKLLDHYLNVYSYQACWREDKNQKATDPQA